MGVYIFVIVLGIFLDVIRYGRRKSRLILYTLVLGGVGALRYNVGTDYPTYIRAINWMINGKELWYESGFVYFAKIILFFTNSPELVLSLLNFATVLCFAYFVMKSVNEKYWLYSMTIFVVAEMYFASFNIMRQFMAVALLLVAITFLRERKYIKYLIFALLASTFHTTALFCGLLFLLTELISHTKSYRFYIHILFVMVIFSALFHFVDVRNIVSKLPYINKYTWYFDTQYIMNQDIKAFFKVIIPDFIWILLYFKRRIIIDNNEKFKFDIQCIAFNCMILNAFSGVESFTRICYYLNPFYITMIPALVEAFSKALSKLLIKQGLRLYFIVLTIVTIFIMGGHEIVPYQTLFSLLYK